MEEGGANVLYLAIGVLKWFESGSSTTERIAPLLLVPIQLEYVRTTRRVRLRHLPEESLPNWTLVEKMRAELAKGKSHSEIIVYPDAGHGFNADYRPSYVEKDAKDGWAKMLSWFQKHGLHPKKA